MFTRRIAYFVPVALLAMVAAASAEAASAAPPAPISTGAQHGEVQQAAAWSASTYQPVGIRRRVVISGYHPAEGFAEELAAEARAARPAVAQNVEAGSALRP